MDLTEDLNLDKNETGDQEEGTGELTTTYL